MEEPGCILAVSSLCEKIRQAQYILTIPPTYCFQVVHDSILSRTLFLSGDYLENEMIYLDQILHML